MKSFYYIFFLTVFLSFFGCNKFDPEEKIPSFIFIDEIKIETSAGQGSNSNSGISDAWVYVGNELIGTFELPATIPVLHEGKKEITIHAGIKRNGIAGNRVKYPMMQEYVIDTTLIPDSVITLKPIVKYESGVTIWEENFETAAVKLHNSTQADVLLETTTSEVFEGNGAGTGVFGSNGTLFEINTDETIFNPLLWNNTVYMELDYALNHLAVVGISYKKANQSTDTDLAYVNLTPTDSLDVKWNKIYIDLSEVTQPNAPFEDLDFFIGLQKTNGSPEPKIFIDNVKIVTF